MYGLDRLAYNLIQKGAVALVPVVIEVVADFIFNDSIKK